MEKTVDISRDSNYSSIFLNCKTDCTLIDLCDFFLYKTASGKDSPLSLNLDSVLNDDQKDALYSKLMTSSSIHEDSFLFSPMLRNKIKEIRTLELSDSTLKCDRVKGFFHQNNPPQKGRKQHKLDAIFKHIRDAFAHGRISFVNEFIIIEDKKKELTARLVISLSVLTIWKKTIEDYIFESKTEA